MKITSSLLSVYNYIYMVKWNGEKTIYFLQKVEFFSYLMFWFFNYTPTSCVFTQLFTSWILSLWVLLSLTSLNWKQTISKCFPFYIYSTFQLINIFIILSHCSALIYEVGWLSKVEQSWKGLLLVEMTDI